MVWPSRTAVVTGAVAGCVNVAVVLTLFARAEYPTLGSVIGVSVLVGTGFVLGLVPVLVSVRTRLLAPTVGFVAVLAATTYLEVTTPQPTWSALDEYVIVDGPTHVASYANTWYLWLSLLLLAGAIEFGLRRGYGIADERLRNLPDLPLSNGDLIRAVTGFASLLGIATVLLVLRAGIRPPVTAIAVFAVAAAVTAVPLAALLTRRLISPVVLFALLVPYLLAIEAFTATDSPVHIFLFGPYAIVLVIAWVVEATIRSRLGRNNGSGFATGNGT
ncbi:hypothetical protein ACLI4Z_13845 [Natrialbaceae archaeon A-arb3/5]